MLYVKAKTLRELWSKANLEILNDPERYVEDCTSSYAFIDGGIFHVLGGTGEGLDLGEVGYSKAKWSHLLRGYFLSESFEAALDSAKKYLGRKQRPPCGIVFFGSRIHKAPGISSSAGQCLLSASLSWAYDNNTPRLMVHSRSTEISKKFYADLVFIHVLLRTFADELEFDPEDVSISWIIPRITQTVDFIPAFLKMQRLDLPSSDHKWIRAIEKSWPTEKDLSSRFRTRKVAAEHFFRVK